MFVELNTYNKTGNGKPELVNLDNITRIEQGIVFCTIYFNLPIPTQEGCHVYAHVYEVSYEDLRAILSKNNQMLPLK